MFLVKHRYLDEMVCSHSASTVQACEVADGFYEQVKGSVCLSTPAFQWAAFLMHSTSQTAGWRPSAEAPTNSWRGRTRGAARSRVEGKSDVPSAPLHQA